MKRVLLIISTSFLPSAQALTQQYFGYTAEQAAAAWTPMGSATGLSPAEKYWLSAATTDERLTQLQALAGQRPSDVWVFEYDFDNHPEFPQQKLAELDLEWNSMLAAPPR